MRFARPLAGLAAAAAAAALVGAGAPALAAGQIGPATTFTLDVHQDGTVTPPADGNAIPNIDSVKSTIRAYYGATKGANPDTAAGAPATIYLPNLTSSPYVTNVKAVEAKLLSTLPTIAPTGAAIVFDVDATLLLDYANEEEMNFNYSPTLNANWVNGHLFPAVPGMPATLKTLHDEGYAIFGITGRPGAQETDTIVNLTEQGFTTDGTAAGTPLFNADNLYTKDVATQPWVDCTLDGNTACSTVEYKALTRNHIETTTGDNIVMNVGDQWSDLEGGYADAYTKIPNPTYFLPSADIPSAPASDSTMVPPTTYTMKPDGSTGATITDGDQIPNEGAVITAIRTYYGASGGTAAKSSSPYITQMNSLTSTWTKQIAAQCRAESADVSKAKAALANARAQVKAATKALAKAGKKGKKAARKALAKAKATAAGIVIPDAPAAVFDADDTTLWNYDLEDGAMGFTYAPSTSAEWIMDEKFPAVPGMVSLAQKVAAAGCTIIGVTGRTSDQQDATIDNLTKVGFVDAKGKPLFTSANYYTKWLSTATPPAYMDCGDDQSCTTIEYKSGTREYIEEGRHLDIVANLGDQFSDLHGGYADATYKVPNPTYYLP